MVKTIRHAIAHLLGLAPASWHVMFDGTGTPFCRVQFCETCFAPLAVAPLNLSKREPARFEPVALAPGIGQLRPIEPPRRPTVADVGAFLRGDPASVGAGRGREG